MNTYFKSENVKNRTIEKAQIAPVINAKEENKPRRIRRAERHNPPEAKVNNAIVDKDKSQAWEQEKEAEKAARAERTAKNEARKAEIRRRRLEYLAELEVNRERISAESAVERVEHARFVAERDAVYRKSTAAEVIRVSNEYEIAARQSQRLHLDIQKNNAELNKKLAEFAPDLNDLVENTGFQANIKAKLLQLDLQATLEGSDAEATLMAVPGIGPRTTKKLLAAYNAVKEVADEAAKKDGYIQKLRKHQEKLVKDQNEATAHAKNLKMALAAIAYGDPLKKDASDDEVRLLAEDFLKRHEDNRIPTEKTTKVNLFRYGQRVVRLTDLLGEVAVTRMHEVAGKNKSGDKNEDAAAANLALAELEDMVASMKDKTFTVAGDKLEIRNMTQSQVAELFGAEPDELCHDLVVLDHDIYGELMPANADNVIIPRRIDGIEYKGAERVKRLIETLVSMFVNKGFTLTFAGRDPEYFSSTKSAFDVLESSASGLKEGVIQCAEHKAYIRVFDALTCGLMGNIPETNGSEFFKVLALFATPSKVFTFGDDKDHPKKIHLRDVIMCRDIKIRFKIPAHAGIMKYGKSGKIKISMEVKTPNGSRTVQIPVEIMDNGEIYIHEVDGFDGLMLGNFSEDVPAFQGRAVGLKFLFINVRGLVEKIIELKPEKYGHLRGKTLTVEDVDNNIQEWKEGRCLATTTIWKMKKWFGGRWSKFVDNAEKLALKYADYDCLRIVAQADAEDEMETNRKTARQLMQQILSISSCDLDKLLSKHAKRAAEGLTFIGAFREMAGIGKAVNKLTDLNQLFRLCPSLAAADEITDYEVAKALDKLATLACGSAPTEEVTLFMAQDPSAMLEIILLGADPDDPDLGLLKANEFGCKSIRFGRKGVVIRFPANGINAARVMENRYNSLFDVCGNIIILNIHDLWIVDNDGDCDGDHAAIFLSVVLVEAVERTRSWLKNSGMLHTVLFDHDSSAKRAKPTREFMNKGKVTAIVNGQAFNLVGRMANAALWAWAKFADCCAKGQFEEAEKWYYTAHLFNVGSILCIDWCKTGVPSKRHATNNPRHLKKVSLSPLFAVVKNSEKRPVKTSTRDIYDAAFALLEASGNWVDDEEIAHAFGRNPWAQAFRNHTAKTPFTKNLMAERKVTGKGTPYLKHNYDMPGEGVIDEIGMKVMEIVGVIVRWTGEIENKEALRFNKQGHSFALDMLGWKEPDRQVKRKVLDMSILRHINPDRLDKKKVGAADDRKIIEQLDAGEAVGLMPMTYFLWRAAAMLETRFQRMLEDAKNNEIVEDARALYLRVARTILLSFDEDADLVVNTVLAYAFNVRTNKVNGETEDETRRLKGNFAVFALKVFAPDLVRRLEIKNNIPLSQSAVDTSLMTLEKVKTFSKDRAAKEEEMLPVSEIDEKKVLIENIFDKDELEINAQLSSVNEEYENSDLW